MPVSPQPIRPMSDQTPIEKAIEALEASKSGLQWYAENAPEHYSEADAEHMVLIDEAIGGLAAHVEAQRPSKVLTDEVIGKLNAPVNLGNYGDLTDKERSYLPLIGEAIHEAYRAGIRYARDNGYLAPAQPLSAQQVFDVVEEFIKQEAERVGTDQPTGLEYPVGHRHWNNMIADLRERLNKLLKTNERE